MSKISDWQAKRNETRWHKDVELNGAGFRNHDGSPVATIRFVVNTKGEDNDALLCAYRDAEQLAKKYTESALTEARRDPDFIQDLKSIHALWRACRDPESDGPAFITPEWMYGKPDMPGSGLNTNQVAYLLNLYNACALEEAGLTPQYDRERVASIRDGIIAAWNSDLPERTLAPLPREHVVAACLGMARSWHDEREALLARVEELEAKLAPAPEPQASPTSQ